MVSKSKTTPVKKDATKVKKDIKKDTKSDRCGVVDEDLEIDEDERHNGECVFFNRKSGYGFIKLDADGLVADNKVMVHWGALQTEDRWPYLMKGTKVELSLEKKRDKGAWVLKAKDVCQPGGDKFSLQQEVDEQKDFVGHKDMRFLGNVKFFDWQKGFGYVKLQEGYAVDEDVPNELRVDREEINAGNDCPRLDKEMEIEFGIQKSKKGIYSCYNVTLAGGEEISRVFVEGREVLKGSFQGEVHFYSISKRFGYIKPNDAAKLPKELKDLLKKDHEKRTKKGKDSEEGALYFRSGDKADGTQRINKGDKVKFSVYKDKLGCGACEVSQI